MKSPCIKVCVVDPQKGRCKGCYRTLDEISNWGRMSEAEREALFPVLEERKKASALDVAEAPVPPLA